MLLSFLEQELIQKINSYYYLFHFSRVFTDVLPTGEADLSWWKNKLFENKKADQRGEQLSDGRCQLEEGDES